MGDPSLTPDLTPSEYQTARDLLDHVGKMVSLRMRGLRLFDNCELKSVEFAVPDKAPDILALLPFALNGIFSTPKLVKQMELLPFAIDVEHEVFAELCSGDQPLDPAPFKMIPVEVEELPEVNTIRAFLKDRKRLPTEALASLITVFPGMVTASLRTVEETCMLILLIIHRLAKLVDAEIFALTVNSPLFKSGLEFFQNANFPLFKEIVNKMARTSAFQLFVIGGRMMQQYTICWEMFRRRFASPRTDKLFNFALRGLKYDGFLALKLVMQACERINMSPDEMLLIVNNHFSEQMRNLLKEKEKLINDPESWYLFMRPLLEMAYIGYAICAPCTPGTNEPNWSKIEPWAKKIHPQLRPKLRMIAEMLKSHGRQRMTVRDDKHS